jgi:general secretion pathway protein D
MIKPPLATPIASVLIASLLIQPSMLMAGGPGASSSSTETTVSRELSRRMAREQQAREEILKGKAAYANKDYEAAFAHFKNACENLADAPATADTREDAVDGLTKSGIKLAEQRVTEGYYASAVQVLQVVLIYNPNDKATLRLLANIEAPDYFNKKMTPGHRANVETVKQLFLDADNYTQLGRYNMALRKYEEILNKDPDNIAARKGRGEVYRLKTQGADAAYDAARSQAVWEVASQWERPYRRFDRKAVEIRSEGRDTRPNTVGITKKLNGIILPRVDFRETTVREAIEFLVQKSKQLDPEAVGVNIVLKLDDQGGGGGIPAAAPAPAAGIPGITPDGGAPAPTLNMPVSGGGGTRITLNLNNVPLIEVIKYITNLANLKYKIEPFSVLILPIGSSTDEMYIREWKVSPTIFRGSMQGATSLAAGADPAAAGAPATSLAGSANAKDFLQSSGVTFNQCALAMYSPATSTLVVKNTQDQLDLVERVIEVSLAESAIKQIEIQAKFVEITQNNLKELTFDWLLGQSNVPGISTNALFTSGGTSGTSPQLDPNDFPFQAAGRPLGTNPVTAGNRSGNLAISANAIDALLFGGAGATRIAPGVFAVTGLTDPSFQVVMRGLDQKKGVDLLSAPRVTTRSGNRAVIEIIREFRYPIEFEQPQIPQTFGNTQGGGVILGAGGAVNPLAFTNSGSFPVTPTTPTTFETRNTGVTLEVEPVIGPDGASIDMQLAPQVVEFEGFINYGSPIQTTSTNALGQSIINVITPNVINQPIFSTRKVSTNVTVFDGATVVLGGLVREDVQKVEDKTPIIGDIPLVGRLFRSNVDQHIKRNLVIFVTARIINAEGQPIAGDDEKEEVVEELGLPEQPMPPLPDGFSKDSRGLK